MIDRIKQLLDWQQLSPTQFADRIGVGRPVVSHILSERNKPSLEVVQRIIAAFPDLSLPWLLSGSGEMLATAAVASAAPATTVVSTAPDAQASLGATAAVQEPAQPAKAIPEFQPTPYQRATPGIAGPTRFRAGATLPAPMLPDPGAPRFVATTNSVNPQPLRPAATQPAADVSSVPLFPVAPAPRVVTVPAPEPVAVPEDSFAAAPPVAPVAPPALADAALLAQVMGENMASPGKTIRRIVLFYTDGSFADFKPE